MNIKLEFDKIFRSLNPFLICGITIAALMALLFLFSYILIWGIIIGAVLWMFFLIKQFLFPTTSKVVIKRETKGRIIEHEDHK